MGDGHGGQEPDRVPRRLQRQIGDGGEFANSTEYRYYRVVFPTIRGGSGAVQVSEIRLPGGRLATGVRVGGPDAPPGGSRADRTDTFTVTVAVKPAG